MSTLFALVLILGAFSSALIAGLFYSYSCSVNIGLGRLADEAYLRAMQQINRAILNPWFLATFIGTLLLLPASLWVLYKQESVSPGFYLMLFSTLTYAIGVFGVTMFGNVPLNEALDKLDITSASAFELKARRSQFEKPWNKLHLIRTIAAVVTLLLILTALTIRL